MLNVQILTDLRLLKFKRMGLYRSHYLIVYLKAEVAKDDSCHINPELYGKGQFK